MRVSMELSFVIKAHGARLNRRWRRRRHLETLKPLA
jgi:hypothetical protein